MPEAIQLKQSTSDTYKNNDFEAFVQEIVNGNVLLMVGKAFEANNQEFKNCHYNNDMNVSAYGWLLNNLNETYHTKAISFSDLSIDEDFVLEDNKKVHCEIHTELSNAINNTKFSVSDVSPQLIRLLRTGYFKFVFTTSFDPLVEIAMKEQWGDVRIKNFYDEDPENQDIDNERDLNVPTLYYLFGKAYKNHFVATDIDALHSIRRWLQRSKTSTLLKETSKIFILALGCDHDDWLFRIIWFILKVRKDNLKDGYVAQYSNNASLEQFLIRNNILINNNSDEVVDAIVKELNKREETNKWKSPNHCDVFISYSRKDGQIAQKLYEALKKKGLDVWYDRINLAGRGDEYMAKILNAIKNCKVFIPVLTSTITEQVGIEHPYRQEWKYAIKRYINLGRRDFCVPLVEEQYDLNKIWYDDGLPEEYPDMDCSFFDKEELDFDEFSKKIQKIVLNLK